MMNDEAINESSAIQVKLLGFLFSSTGKHTVKYNYIVFHIVALGSRFVSYWFIVIQFLEINQCCKATTKYFCITFYPAESRYNKGLRDWQNIFALLRFRYIRIVFHNIHVYSRFSPVI